MRNDRISENLELYQEMSTWGFTMKLSGKVMENGYGEKTCSNTMTTRLGLDGNSRTAACLKISGAQNPMFYHLNHHILAVDLLSRHTHHS